MDPWDVGRPAIGSEALGPSEALAGLPSLDAEIGERPSEPAEADLRGVDEAGSVRVDESVEMAFIAFIAALAARSLDGRCLSEISFVDPQLSTSSGVDCCTSSK